MTSLRKMPSNAIAERMAANFSSTVTDSISEPKILLTQIFQHLKESFLVSNLASSEMIDQMRSALQIVDHSMIASETLKKGSIHPSISSKHSQCWSHDL